MLSVILTVVWIGMAGQPDEVVTFNTDSMAYCMGLVDQLIEGDGADLAWCEYTVEVVEL